MGVTMPRTKQLNIKAILKAYEAEAKRAERNAKAYRGDSLEAYWLGHACKVRQYKQLAEQETAQ
jgi:hypothetical protein